MAEIDELEERLYYQPPELRWSEYKLTPAESMLFDVLMNNRGKVIPKEHLYSRLYQLRGASDAPEMKIVDVMICKIRKKLFHYEQSDRPALSIGTVWARGYFVPREGESQHDAVNYKTDDLK
jgi:two-component system cell cycle response regulator CtrA